LENYQWCGEPCFAGAAISIDGYLPQNPRRVKKRKKARGGKIESVSGQKFDAG
jgi:hypothetical protein